MLTRGKGLVQWGQWSTETTLSQVWLLHSVHYFWAMKHIGADVVLLHLLLSLSPPAVAIILGADQPRYSLTLFNTGGGPYGPPRYIYSFLDPLWSKLSAHTFWLFLNIPKDHFRTIKNIPKKFNLRGAKNKIHCMGHMAPPVGSRDSETLCWIGLRTKSVTSQFTHSPTSTPEHPSSWINGGCQSPLLEKYWRGRDLNPGLPFTWQTLYQLSYWPRRQKWVK